MQVHGPSDIIEDPKREVRARYNSPGLVVLSIGSLDVHIHTAEDADALIAAAVEAKRLISPPVITDSARTCTAKHPDTGDWCVIEGPHTGHRDCYGETWTIVHAAEIVTATR